MHTRIEQLKKALKPYTAEGIVLAFSGGTDSAFLLAVLLELRRENPFPFSAVMMCSPFQKPGEQEHAKRFAESLGLSLICMEYDPFQMEELRNNPPERCYFCKKFFFSAIRNFAVQNGKKWVFDGTNSDDLQEHRPGQKALQEAEIRSPLAENGFSKQEIRQCSRFMKLSTADLPAAPCLATRFPYGTPLTPEKIRFAAECEQILERFLPEGVIRRIRFLRDKTIIETEVSCLPELQRSAEILLNELREAGCPAPEIDPEGYRSGKFD